MRVCAHLHVHTCLQVPRRGDSALQEQRLDQPCPVVSSLGCRLTEPEGLALSSHGPACGDSHSRCSGPRGGAFGVQGAVRGHPVSDPCLPRFSVRSPLARA